jgi:ABC-type branched-subunit amino acid transport system substrate-binding protein
VLRHYGRGGRADAVRLNLSRLELERGHRDAADRALRGLRYRRLSNEQKRAAYRLRVDLADDSVEKLRWLERVRALTAETPGDERSLMSVDAEIDALLAGMSRKQLGRALEQLGRHIPAGRAGLYAAAADMDGGDWERAAEDLAAVEDLELTPADRELLEQLAQRLRLHEMSPGLEVPLPSFAEVALKRTPVTEGAVGTIGVVLPLSGTYARFGEESLRGVLLAARIFEPQPLEWSEDAVEADELGRLPRVDAGYDSFDEAEPRDIASAPLQQIGELRIAVRDSAGDPERAARAVRELARDENAVAIIGPLLFRESEAAARVAEEEEIPLLCLTSREEVSRDRPYVLRLRTTPEDELGFLVAYASERLGAERFAVLYPDDNYGRGMRNRFWQAVEERGGYVIAASAYDPVATDFAEPIRRMIGYQLLTADERKALAERELFLRRGRRLPPESATLVPELAARITGPEGEPLPPIVDFDALFIPDSHDKIVLIAPQLAFHELTGVQLLGSDGWNHPDLLEIAREHVSGAVISALFDANSLFPFVARFVDDYIATFGVSPNVYSAHGFDAVNLVLVQLAAGVRARSELRDGVLQTRGYPGVSGVTTFLPDGNARKRPFLLEVRGRRIAPLD